MATRSSIALPLRDESGTTFGALSIHSAEALSFTPDETRLLEELAGDLAFGITVLRTREERSHAVEELRRSEEQLRQAQRITRIGSWRYDAATGRSDWSDECYRVFGIEPGRPIDDSSFLETIHPDDRVAFIRVWSAAQHGEPYEFEHRILVDGKTRWIREQAECRFDAAGIQVEAIGTSEDITERRRLEEQLRQAQKMEAIGRLAGGVAHDFNNLLTAINGYADILLSGMAPDEPRRADAEEIRKAGERASALTRQLLAFSRRQVLQPVVLDPNGVVTGITPMLRRLVGEQIDVRTVLAPDLGRVLADASQLEQVLLNLAVNARDAMPGGGTLTIETANVELDDEYRGLHPLAAPGPHVLLAVSDTGVGMDADTMAHLFEPFFTTKATGEGTGFGLATVYGIVTGSGGRVDAYSEPGVGSAFKVYLPRVSAAVESPAGAAASPVPGGTERILLVEDDDAVRAYVARVLGGLGYVVSTARSGTEALALSAQHPEPIDLLVTDVMLPGINGRELAGRLAAERPGLRTLYISGYTQDSVVHQGLLEPGVAFLGKPFTPDALGRAIREALAA